MNNIATDAPAALGALVAAQQCLELEVVLAERPGGEAGGPTANFEVYQDLRHHKHYVSLCFRNPLCRFDHQSWVPERAEASTVGSLFEGCGADPRLGVEGERFTRELRCPGCGLSRAVLCLSRRLDDSQSLCPDCSNVCLASAFTSSNELALSALDESTLQAPPQNVGLEENDLVTVTAGDGSVCHRILGGPPPAGPSVVLVGCGNIGSQVVPHLARLDGVERVVVIDPDRYEPANLAGQAIRACDLGKRKVDVAAETIRSIAPDLPVLAVPAAVERVPLGLFQGAVVIAAVDSRAARMKINKMAWRVASCWIDGAVDGDNRLARMTVYRPGEDSACYECGFDADDYAAVEQVYPCRQQRDSDTNVDGRTRSG